MNRNNIHLSFTAVEADSFFSILAAALNTQQVNNNIHVPGSLGTGMVHRKKINDGITFISWDIRVSRKLVFTKKPVVASGENRSFIISYLLNTQNILMDNPAVNKKARLKGIRNILFMTDDAEVQFEVPPGEPLKVVNICVGLPWLKKELFGADLNFLDFLDQLGDHTKHPAVFMEYSPPAEYRALLELNPANLQGELGDLHLKAKLFSLLADFFARVFQHSTKGVVASRVLHHEKMMEVEVLLKQHLEKTLPDMGAIARQMALSVSTLKRHFKVMFGKGIYDHYLELKMEHARKLLSEKPLSVNEVACMLDYEKVSSFIHIFKKHHGFSPGTLRRKSA